MHQSKRLPAKVQMHPPGIGCSIPDAMKYPERVTTSQRVLQGLATYRLLYGILNGWQPTVVEWKLRETAGGQRVPLKAYRDNRAALSEGPPSESKNFRCFGTH